MHSSMTFLPCSSIPDISQFLGQLMQKYIAQYNVLLKIKAIDRKVKKKKFPNPNSVVKILNKYVWFYSFVGKYHGK